MNTQKQKAWDVKKIHKREKKKNKGIYEVTHLTVLIMTDIPSRKTQHS